jgi:hypothetical protein
MLTLPVTYASAANAKAGSAKDNEARQYKTRRFMHRSPAGEEAIVLCQRSGPRHYAPRFVMTSFAVASSWNCAQLAVRGTNFSATEFMQ